MTLIWEKARPRRRTSPSVRLPVIYLASDGRKSNYLTVAVLFKGKIDLLEHKGSFGTAQMITKFTSIIKINHLIINREIIAIYCRILKNT